MLCCLSSPHSSCSYLPAHSLQRTCPQTLSGSKTTRGAPEGNQATRNGHFRHRVSKFCQARNPDASRNAFGSHGFHSKSQSRCEFPSSPVPGGQLEPPWLYAGGTQGLQEVRNVLTSRHTSPFLQLTFVSALVLEKAEGKAGTPGLMRRTRAALYAADALHGSHRLVDEAANKRMEKRLLLKRIFPLFFNFFSSLLTSQRPLGQKHCCYQHIY